jgi:hypothetical protein
MAIVGRLAHRWWVSLVPVLGAMLVPAGASAGEIEGKTVRQNIPNRVRLDQLPGAARPEPALPLRSHKHRVAFPRFARANEPNDDETSRDPSDDETSDDFVADDGTDDVPIATWLQNIGRQAIPLEAKSALARTEPAACLSLSRHPLRC